MQVCGNVLFLSLHHKPVCRALNKFALLCPIVDIVLLHMGKSGYYCIHLIKTLACQGRGASVAKIFIMLAIHKSDIWFWHIVMCVFIYG